MKKIKLDNPSVTISNQPLVAVIGTGDNYRNRIINDLLSNKNFYSKKYGRIIYVGERRYKSPSIVLDAKNSKEACSYEEFIDFLDEAKQENIVNLLFVINTKDFNAYEDIIEKLIGVRFTYLKGLISIIYVINTPKSIKKSLFTKFNTIFYLETEFIDEIAEIWKVKGKIEEKRKKDAYVISEGKIEVLKDIKD